MNSERLLKHFERISEAPEAVARLRRFILDLAVRGKLVAQDPNDEPAAELLKRIQAEKERLGRTSRRKGAKKGGETGQEKLAGLVALREMPFVVPKSWAYACLGDVAQYGIPDKVNSNREITPDTWVLDLEDIEKDTSRLVDRVLSSMRPFLSTKTVFRQGDVLFGKLRPYLNKVLVADHGGVCTTEIIPIRGYCGMVPDYVKLVLKSPLTMERVDQLMYGMKMPRLGTVDAAGLSFPLPPLAEQHRIVAKVDELMGLCDQLEAARNEREARRDRLVAASLHHLQNADDLTPSRQDAKKSPTTGKATLGALAPRREPLFLQNLPCLTTRPEHIKQLRQTILNLAVRGRLVSQDPNDEPAAELMKRIAAGKKAFKRTVSTSAACPSERVPDGWCTVDLSDYALEVCTGPFGSALHKSDYITGGIPLVNPSHMVNDRIIPEEKVSVSPCIAERLSSYRLEPGDIVMARRGEVGRAALVETGQKGWLCGTGSFYLRFSHEINRYYFLLLLRSAHLRAYLAGKAVGTTMVNLNHNILNKARLEIPPLAEQHRIVAKVDELMALCDQLETQLTTSQVDSRRLLEAVLRDALAPVLAEAM